MKDTAYNILIHQNMAKPNTLRLMLDWLAINNGMLEWIKNWLVNGSTEVFYSAGICLQHNWRCIVRGLALGFGIYPLKVQLRPPKEGLAIALQPGNFWVELHHLKQFVNLATMSVSWAYWKRGTVCGLTFQPFSEDIGTEFGIPVGC